MVQPRKNQISLSDTPYYHVVSRCVRRSYLCGVDPLTQHSYEHRRQWIEDRIRLLSSVFAVEICAYAVMSNHFHLVVKLVPNETNTWDRRAVITRWLRIFKGPLLIQQFINGKHLCRLQLETVDDIVAVWKKRLSDLSWFMKCLNEPIARRANKEDECTGHFWESRFRCQPLLTDQALLCCMAYVDLNPIRAGISNSLEDSDYTSIKERISPDYQSDQLKILQVDSEKLISATKSDNPIPIRPLASFADTKVSIADSKIPMQFDDYVELLNSTRYALIGDLQGDMVQRTTEILKNMGFNGAEWIGVSQQFESQYQKKFSKRSLMATKPKSHSPCKARIIKLRKKE